MCNTFSRSYLKQSIISVQKSWLQKISPQCDKKKMKVTLVSVFLDDTTDHSDSSIPVIHVKKEYEYYWIKLINTLVKK